MSQSQENKINSNQTAGKKIMESKQRNLMKVENTQELQEFVRMQKKFDLKAKLMPQAKITEIITNIE